MALDVLVPQDRQRDVLALELAMDRRSVGLCLTPVSLLRADVGVERIVNLALDESALSPRELAVRFTDTEGDLSRGISLIASPAFIAMKAADEFQDKTTAPNQLWQTDFTYLKVIGWGCFYLSTVLDDFSRYIIAWKLCTTMKADDVTATLELALDASGLDKASVLHRPRLLSDNGSSYISDDLAKWMTRHAMAHVRGAPNLNSLDRFVLGLGSLFVPANRIPKLAVIRTRPTCRPR